MRSHPTDLVFLTPYPLDAETLSRLLAPTSLRIHHASTLAQAETLLITTPARVLVTETIFSDGNWEDVVEVLAERHPHVVVVVTAVHADERLWAETINRGAYDLIPRPFYAPELCRILESAHSYATRYSVHAMEAAS